jgi:hypothetical protein
MEEEEVKCLPLSYVLCRKDDSGVEFRLVVCYKNVR